MMAEPCGVITRVPNDGLSAAAELGVKWASEGY